MYSTCFPRSSLPADASLSSTGSSGRVPLLQRYYQSATTSCRPSRRASLPSLGGTSVALVVFAPQRTSEPLGPGVGNPVSPAGSSPRSEQGSPKFLGNQLSVCTCSNPTPAGLLAPDHYGCSSVALGHRKAKAPTKGLSTLNSMAFGLAVYAS